MIIHCSAHFTKFRMSLQSFMQIVAALNNIFIEAVVCRLNLQTVALVEGSLYDTQTRTIASTNSV
jgi:hypothetical protein